MLEPTHEDENGSYYLRWACYRCRCYTVPVAKHLLDANDERAISTFHPCPVCGHAVQLPRDLSNPDWWELRNREARTEHWLTLDDEPLRRPWPDELPGLEDERLRHGSYGDWRELGSCHPHDLDCGAVGGRQDRIK